MSFSSGLQFRVIDGQREKDRVIRLDGKELTLGRAQKGQRPTQGEVLFREPTVSRVHASLSWKERQGGFQLTHKSGTNATLVNGKATKKVLLTPGDRVQMGLLILELEDAPPTRASAPAPSSSDRGRASMTEPILEALSKVERQHEEDRRRTKADNEQKQRKRELMASAEPYQEPTSPTTSRSRRLDEALKAAPPRLDDERRERRHALGFGWQPPEERHPQPSQAHDQIPPTEAPSRIVVSYQDAPTPPIRLSQPPSTPPPSPHPVDPPLRRREAVFELVVVKGPDQGRRFPLKDMVMVLGQRQGEKDEREEQGVLLNDATLPAELGMFAWQGREDAYGLLASENSMQIIEVDRISDGVRRRIRVDSVSSLLLKVADEIQIGLTTLRVQRIGEPIPTQRHTSTPDPTPLSFSRPEAPHPSAPPHQDPPHDPPRRPHPTPYINPTRVNPTRQNADPWRHPSPTSSAASNPVPVTRSTPPTQRTSIAEDPLPLWSQSTLVPGRDDTTQPPSNPAPRPNVSSAPLTDEDVLEWGTRPNADFLFEFLAGPMRGCLISMNRSELIRPRRYNAGTIGARVNELTLEGDEIGNEAFQLIGEDGRFSLVNESPSGQLIINRAPLKTGDRLVLMTGDLITIGATRLRFLEREVVQALAQHSFYTESGVTSDQDRTFHLTRQRLVIGRGKGCEIRLSDLEVSRIHLGVAYSEGRFSIQHRSETNPTFLNGLSLLPGAVRTLKAGDRIRLSSLTVLRFMKQS